MVLAKIVVASFVLGALVVACGGKVEGSEGDGPSSSTSPAPGVVAPNACQKACPNDPEPPADAVAQCKSGEDPSGAGCKNEYVAVLNCFAGKVVCKDGKTDPEASAQALFVACGSAIFAYQGCASKGFDAGRLGP
ncbi:MAG: hypothetical protein U0183_12100 [Polyangiaceae bacterium]|jgi:hypothetical protein